MNPRIRRADFDDPRHCAGLVAVLDAYASDPAGGGRPLPDDVRARLVTALRAHPTALVWLAFVGEQAVGIAVCFEGFSTFVARPLLNIHDLAVVAQYRGQGIGTALLAAVETEAASRGCCKLTLEVQDANQRARAVYERFGFTDFVVAGSSTRFLSKPLRDEAHE
jgi:ribosomal protein S18 acetylase RimI-like enzyme